jgi:hypothetical protein
VCIAALAIAILAGCSSFDPPEPPAAASTSDLSSSLPDITTDAVAPPTVEPPVEPPIEPPVESQVAPPVEPQQASTVVSGHTYDSNGAPLGGVLLQFYLVPRGFGDLYRVESGPDGSYAYELPEGVYNVLATYYFSDAPGDEAGLLTDAGELNVPLTVPPGQEIDWYLP